MKAVVKRGHAALMEEHYRRYFLSELDPEEGWALPGGCVAKYS